MIIRALDASGDWQFGRGKQSFLTGQPAIAENIQTRLKCWKGDCFFDLNAGLDWVRLLGSKNTLQEIILTVRSVILASYGAVKVDSIIPELNDRDLRLTYTIDTIFTRNFSQSIGV